MARGVGNQCSTIAIATAAPCLSEATISASSAAAALRCDAQSGRELQGVHSRLDVPAISSDRVGCCSARASAIMPAAIAR